MLRDGDQSAKAHNMADEHPDTDPNDSELLRDELKGQTEEHAEPPRLEDEGQSGG